MSQSSNESTSGARTEGRVAAHDPERFDNLGTVVAEIAQDFNNAFTLISAYVEMALTEIKPGSRAHVDLQHALAAGDRAAALVERIRDFARQARLPQAAIDPVPPVLEALAWLRQRLPGNVRLHSEIGADALRVCSHPAELRQLVMNLCSNSLQAMAAEGGDLLVALEHFDQHSLYWREHEGLEPRAYVKLLVRDSGCGMDPATQEQMYSPFFSATPAAGGELRPGLGLTTVFNIVSAQRGLIFVESDLDRGTRFEICLPLATSHRPALSVPSAQASRRGPHILFVDDESTITAMARQILEQEGYRVTAHTDPHQALEAFRRQPRDFDLVIADLVMPFMSGTALAQEINALQPAMPIVLATAHSAKITSESCRQWGITVVLDKPFTLQDLLGTVARQLAAGTDA